MCFIIASAGSSASTDLCEASELLIKDLENSERVPHVTGPGNSLLQSLSVHFYCLHGRFSENDSEVSVEVSGDGQTGSDPSNADEKTCHGTGGDGSNSSGGNSGGNILASCGTRALKRGMKHYYH